MEFDLKTTGNKKLISLEKDDEGVNILVNDEIIGYFSEKRKALILIQSWLDEEGIPLEVKETYD